MESVVLASTLPNKIDIEETEHAGKNEEEKPQISDDKDGGLAGRYDEVEDCTKDAGNGDDPAHEEELENKVDDVNGDGEDEGNMKKEIVFDNDDIIKKAF